MLIHVTEAVVHHHHGDDYGLPGPEAFDPAYDPDRVELTTVGVDIGSSTSHLAFSRLLLRRLGKSMSSRYVVVERRLLHRSPIVLTPYRPDQTIDAARVGRLVDAAMGAARLTADDIDSGVVILTGEALRRVNARAVAESVAAHTGRLVAASAGHNMEALLAAHGAGAVELSRRTGRTMLHLDVGGGTTKLALVRAGEVVATGALNVGGRLVAFAEDGAVERIEPAAREIADAAGVELALGRRLDEAACRRLAATMCGCMLDAMRPGPAGGLAAALTLTDPVRCPERVDAVTFSGGVSEFVHGRATAGYGDLGPHLGEELRHAAAEGRLPGPMEELADGIRATVLGASQYTAQVSGDTITVTRPGVLPLRDLPVLRVDLADGDVAAGEVAAGIAAAARRLDVSLSGRSVAVALGWAGRPTYANLRALAEGVARGCTPAIAAGIPLALVFGGDIGKLVGEILRNDVGVTSDVVSIDGVDLRELDFIDIGQPIETRRVVPVIVRSLIFAAATSEAAELAS